MTGTAELLREIGPMLGVLAEDVDRIDDHFSAFRWLLGQASARRHVRDQDIRFWPKLLRIHVRELVTVYDSGQVRDGRVATVVMLGGHFALVWCGP